uniref:Uroplakin 3B n=1 Tax=Crocodylus porosus TaxID=8502 RepID=A0A7M4EDT9_CROPO
MGASVTLVPRAQISWHRSVLLYCRQQAMPFCLWSPASLEQRRNLVPYTPQITGNSLEGKLTASTFSLDQPICIFDQYVNATDDIWLVVAFANATSSVKNPTSRNDIPPYQRLSTALHYMTLRTTITFFPCPRSSNTSVLRVGSDAFCRNDNSRQHCNGPLPNPGPYRPPPLLSPSAAGHRSSTIDTWPGRRSGTMIVITVILSSLVGILTLAFLCTSAYDFKLWQREDPAVAEEPPAGSFKGRHYDTHHIPPSQAPPQPPSDVPGSPAASS